MGGGVVQILIFRGKIQFFPKLLSFKTKILQMHPVMQPAAFTDRLVEPVTSQQAQDPIAPHIPTYPPPTRPTNPLWAGSSNGHHAASILNL